MQDHFSSSLDSCCSIGAVLEHRPDVPVLDLRITYPFPALEEYAQSFDLSDPSVAFYAPFVVILYHMRQLWLSSVE